MIDEAVSKLVTYALRTGLIQENETVWAVNTILDALKLDSYTDPGKEWEELEPVSYTHLTLPTKA